MGQENIRQMFLPWRAQMGHKVEEILEVPDPAERVQRLVDLVYREREAAADKALDRTRWGLGWGD